MSNTTDKDMQAIGASAESEWASMVINTLLIASQKGEMSMPRGFSMQGISITRRKGNAWDIGFHVVAADEKG